MTCRAWLTKSTCIISKLGETVCRVEEPALRVQIVQALLDVLDSGSCDVQETSLEQLKVCAKRDQLPSELTNQVTAAVYPLTQVKSFVVKEAAKRAMLYLLQVQRGEEATRAVLRTLGGQGPALGDFVKKSLLKLAEEGDSDEDSGH